MGRPPVVGEDVVECPLILRGANVENVRCNLMNWVVVGYLDVTGFGVAVAIQASIVVL